jgi:hypothetical protein
MPIRESEKARYPKDWKAISKRIRGRAGNRCEQCRAENGTRISRGSKMGQHSGKYMTDDGRVFSETTGEFFGMCRGSEWDHGNFVHVVLTVAHLDHTPENCADDNLRAWCQKCHLTYDAAHHARNGAATRRSRKAAGDLFDATAR